MSQTKGRDVPPAGGDAPVTRHKAARTTIVGGQPPGNDREAPPIPVALEHLLGLAAVNPELCEALKTRRTSLVDATGLELTASEQAILEAVPEAALTQMIHRMDRRLPEPDRRAFLEQAALVVAAMLGAGALVSSAACKPASRERSEEPYTPATKGVRPDRPEDGKDPDDPAPEGRPTEDQARPSDLGAAGERPAQAGAGDGSQPGAAEAGGPRPSEAGPGGPRPGDAGPGEPRPGEAPPTAPSQEARPPSGTAPDVPEPQPGSVKPAPRPRPGGPPASRGVSPDRPEPRPRPKPMPSPMGIRPDRSDFFGD